MLDIKYIVILQFVWEIIFSIDNSEPLKVEFTIVLKIIDGKLKLILHDSHLPFQK